MQSTHRLFAALVAALVGFGAQAQSVSSNEAQPNGATPVPEAKAAKRVKKTPTEKKSLTADAEKSGAGSNDAAPNGESPSPRSAQARPKRTLAEKKATAAEAERSGAGTDSAEPNGAAPVKHQSK